MRTTRPSIPRAKNAIVGLPPRASSASSRCATISASADSDVPHVFSERDTITAASPDRRSRSGTTCSVTINCISYGTPGTAYTTFPFPSSHSNPGAVPIGFGDRVPAVGDVGLAQVVLRHVAQPGAEHRRNVLRQCHVAHEPDTHHLRDRVAGQVVLGRAEAAAHEHRVGPVEQVAQSRDDPSLVVADHPVLEGVDPRRRQLLADPGAVRVDDLAEQQLRADGKHLASHRRILARRRPGPAGPET